MKINKTTLCIIFVLLGFASFLQSSEARNVTLAWDPNTEMDLAGYRVYYKKGSGSPPYDGSGALEGFSPIDVGNVTTFAITGLSDSESHYFVVTALNNGGMESGYSNEVRIPAAPLNLPPVADAGPDQAADEKAEVILSALNSTDPDDGIASYLWEQVSGTMVTPANPNAAETSFIAPDVASQSDVLTFRLTVTDKAGNRSSDTCLINVTWINGPPVANAGADQTVLSSNTVFLDGSKSYDGDDGIGSALWTQTAGPCVALSDPASLEPSFVAPTVGMNGASLTFELTVTDRGGLQAKDTCVVNVSWVNQPPTAEAGPDQAAREGDTVLLNGSSSTDPDDSIISYAWTQTLGTPASLDNPVTSQPRFAAPVPAQDGETLTFQLKVTDKGGLQSIDKCNIIVRHLTPPPPVSAVDLTGSWAGLVRYSKRGGSWIKGYFQVKNLGSQKASSFVVRFYSSDDAILGPSDVLVSSSTVRSLGANASLTLSVQTKASSSPVYLIAFVDAANVIAEDQEANNVIVSGRQ